MGGAQTRKATAGAQPGRGGEGFLLRREIEHKALLPQVQALYTRATDYLVSNYKAISHQSSVRISQRITKAISQPMSHQSLVGNEELRQQEGVSKNKQERISRNKQDDTAEAQVRQHLCVMQNVA